jgi:short-subunit dehydrogenase
MQSNERPTALVTGATGGIGHHLVAQCIADGMRVIAAGRDEQGLAALHRGVAGDALQTCRVDLLSEDAVDTLAAACDRAGRSLQLLVNCAGRGQLARFAEAAIDEQRDLCRLNFEAAVVLTHGLIARLVDGRGQVLNIASLVGHLPATNMAMLSASKAALLNWSLALRAELRGRVGVTTFCPGITRTPFLARAGMAHLRLDERFFAHDAAHVARRALDAARRNQAIAYANLLDRAGALSMRLVPASVLARVASVLFVPRDQ